MIREESAVLLQDVGYYGDAEEPEQANETDSHRFADQSVTFA